MPDRPAPAWPEEYGRLVLPEVDSTNAEALRRLPELGGPCWILSRRQTAGRGRRGRGWADPAGNFAATLAIRLQASPAHMALRSFAAALALHDALVAVTGLAQGFALKWPNDVLLNGGKLSGILLESGGGGALAVGIGVNLRAAPPADPGAAFAPVSLRAETGLSLSPEHLLDHLAPAFAQWEGRLQTYGFTPLRAAFLDRVTRLGEPILARTMTDTIEGRFATIDESGALVLATTGGQRVVPAAEIFFP
ncbi:MAG: bifunctional biotin operon repressor / biotin-[acetyl-CoA-carboxylase] ligase BirA [Rhodobacteraceae bacterium HLUCCA12]|nr:MAG: bifunctional biotin operon repressor / biotin-[acetyl-CoA-carboxylase] ligase BirA [Rhodobacteraceae bacterium HLUCCA12]